MININPGLQRSKGHHKKHGVSHARNLWKQTQERLASIWYILLLFISKIISRFIYLFDVVFTKLCSFVPCIFKGLYGDINILRCDKYPLFPMWLFSHFMGTISKVKVKVIFIFLLLIFKGVSENDVRFFNYSFFSDQKYIDIFWGIFILVQVPL